MREIKVTVQTIIVDGRVATVSIPDKNLFDGLAEYHDIAAVKVAAADAILQELDFEFKLSESEKIFAYTEIANRL